MSGLKQFIILILAVLLCSPAALAQTETYCLPGQEPHFRHGFAFLKQQLGDIMGEPLECEHYDETGNAYQRTSTGQAFYRKHTNIPSFTAGNRHWAWTPNGLEQWTGQPPEPATGSPPPPAVSDVRVMSYNILFGAGASPDWEQRAARLSPFAYPGNRLPAVLAVIKAAEPDILGLQEAAGWDRGTPSLVQQVADELKINYYLAPTPSELDLALLTRFEIVETENLSDRISSVGALRVTLALPNLEQHVHVFVVHLDPFSAETRAGQIAILTEAMAPYFEAPTILMGDTNVTCLDDPGNCQEYRLLSQAGWRLVMREKYLINQIWTSPLLDRPLRPVLFPEATFAISDHLPLGAIIEVAPPRRDPGRPALR